MKNFSSLNDSFVLSNGYKIPCIGFGTWQTPDGETAINSVKEAIKLGYKHIDTAAAINILIQLLSIKMKKV